MSTNRPPAPLSFWHRMLRLHLRLLLATLAALVVYLVTPTLSSPGRFLVAWDVGTALWLVLVLMLVAGGTAERVKQRAAEEDEGAVAILIITLLASLLSLVAVIQEAGSVKGGNGPGALQIALAVGTLALSWAFIHGSFAMHYAREYYRRGADAKPMLAFPGAASPDFWDFFYFSFTIGTASQTADVSINSQRLRRLVLGHQIVAYVFNTAVLALGVNVAAGLV
ncbi:membrane protein [Azorhizobium oxalatiphilum]|uniref:Membrane protein n=1 Tax=Azorhizobium oxalatiphilum TaxID=980631 RepID=A0A917C9A3_9HYPH|nr:DUF1345 domain-containing protein [Azorhizobium oxalatiphilum]GGF76901.1 membrane protein [Azorhizobium oxalatiphilum]